MIADFRLQIADFRLQISDFRFEKQRKMQEGGRKDAGKCRSGNRKYRKDAGKCREKKWE